MKILGEKGPAVLLLPGGAESVVGFFPVIEEGLLESGARVIHYDRPGSGATPADGDLRDAARHVHAALADAGLGPVVVVGQSLGGAVALLLAVDHPEDVAGLMLIDPTPVNDAALARKTARGARSTVSLGRRAPGRWLVRALLRRTVAKSIRAHAMTGEVEAAIRAMGELDLEQLGAGVAGLEELGAAFDESRLPTVPAIVATADRKAGSHITAAHRRAAVALGGRVETWPGLEHHGHLSHPERILELVREVVRESRR